MSTDKYTNSQFKVLIDLLKGKAPDEFKDDLFKQLFNGLAEKHRTYIEEKAVALKAIDEELQGKLGDDEILKNLFIFQLHVLRGYLNDIAIEDSNINTKLVQLNQKFSQLVDISTKGLLPSGFNSKPLNNLTKLQERIQSHISLIDRYLAQKGGDAFTQKGGDAFTDYIKFIKKLTDVYSIFNSDLLLKAMSLYSSSSLSEGKFGQDIFSKMKDLFALLFINMNEYKALTPKVYDIHVSLKSKVERDTKIYNVISAKLSIQNSEEMILIKTLFDSLKLEEQDKTQLYLNNPELSEDFLKLLTLFITQIEPISVIYKFLYDQYANIDRLYEDHVEDKKKVFAYVKERNDNGIKNKRFTIRETNKFLSLKYAADDEIDETNRAETKDPEYYYFGPYTDTFSSVQSNEEVADSTSKLILNRLIDKREHVFVLGYGQSGAGKTSTLISSNYTDESGLPVKELGIIPLILKNPKFLSGTTTIEMEVIELYVENDKHTFDYIDLKYIDTPNKSINGFPINIKYLNKRQPYSFTYTQATSSWNNSSLKESIEQYMLYCVDKRRTYPTSNNPDSSRSHILIILKCKQVQNSSFLICGDLAGVENAFDCNDIMVIKKMVTSFGKSKQDFVCSGAGGKCVKVKEYPNWDPLYDSAYVTINEPDESTQKTPEALTKINKLKELQRNYTNLVMESKKEISQMSQAYITQLINSIIGFDYSIFKKGKPVQNYINGVIAGKRGINDIFIKIIMPRLKEDLRNTFVTFAQDLKDTIDFMTTAYFNSQSLNAENKKAMNDRKIIINAILSSCRDRTIEGRFINKTLKEMREDIKSVLISNFNNDTLYFDKSIFPYCINTTIKQSKLERFYTNSDNTEIKGSIMNIVKNTVGSNDELKKINFVIFTIIKTDTKNYYNNPPNAPYINTNELYYNTHINSDPNALDTAIENIRVKAMDTSFYQKDENKPNMDDSQEKTMEKLQPIAIDLLNKIDTINDATLIGSLISTEKLNNLIFDKMICSYNKDFDKILEQFNQNYFPVKSTPLNDSFSEKTNLQELEIYNQSIRRKYMKYKSKYMMKLKSRALKK